MPIPATGGEGGLRAKLIAAWPLWLALAAATAAYYQAMNSPLYGDDYIYLRAARDLPFGEYVRAVFTPWGSEPLLPFTRDFWRPLPFLWFEIAEPVFGGNTVGYHVFNLTVHLLSVVLVWRIATRLDPRTAVCGVAALVFALYPGSFEAITWISSANSVGLPFALGAWLAFVAGTTPGASAPARAEPTVRWRYVAASAALMAVGLACRESATAVLPAMGTWYLLVQNRTRLGESRSYLPFVPFVAVGAAYFLIRTRLLTEPFANPDIYAFDSDYPERWWFYVKNALLPFRDPVTGWRDPAQDAAGVAMLGIPLVALVRRRWDVFALSTAVIVSMLPYGATLLGVGQRYFYFSTPILALMLAILAADAVAMAGRRQPATERFALPALAGVLALGSAISTASRIENWIEIAPDRQQRWVDGLRSAHPTLPVGGTLYCANVPLILAVFDAANLEPTVRWYYPEVGEVVYFRGPEPPVLGPDDRYHDADRPGDTPAQP